MDAGANHFLREYLDKADANSARTRSERPDVFILIEECEEIIPQLLSVGKLRLGPAGYPLAYHAYFIFLAAVRTALSGHPVAVMPLLRTSLESICYALVISRNRALEDTWRSRHDSEADLKANKKAFGPAVAEAAKIASEWDEKVGSLVLALYEGFIDFGAHPNPRGFRNHLRQDGTNTTEFGCLYQSGPMAGVGLLTCVELGVVLGILLLIAIDENDPIQLEILKVIFIDLMARKDQCADEINGEPIQYTDELYEKIDRNA